MKNDEQFYFILKTGYDRIGKKYKQWLSISYCKLSIAKVGIEKKERGIYKE